MRFSSLNDWLAWLETCHPQAIELGLDRVSRVFAAMNLLAERYNAAGSSSNPVPKIARKVVTVAGTNGKGSCVATLEALLLAHGVGVGAYTSPHLLRYNERVRINGVEADDASLCEAFAAVDAARGAVSLTYFEFGTLAAFYLFARANLDVVILEVGLGGRLDAVNLLDADIAVITSIALDHTDWLGDTREAIGVEKAGILRDGIDFICGDTDAPASLHAAACARNTNNFFIGDAFGFSTSAFFENGDKVQSFDFFGRDSRGRRVEYRALPLPSLPWPSVAMALQALLLLDDIVTPELSMLPTVLSGLALAGRFQHFTRDGLEIIVDVAHNPAGAAFLCSQLQATPVAGKTLAVFTMLADKDLDASIAAIKPAITAWFVAELPGNARARVARDVADALFRAGIHMISVSKNLKQAFARARMLAQPGDRIVIFGSFYVASELLPRVLRQQGDDADE